MKKINLISDTVTRPTPAMLNAMLKAEVGDDVFKSDPSVNALQTYAADLFGKPDALFCPSGTMTNQLAIKVHTNPLDEMICEESSHVYQYETGGFAYNSRISVRLIRGQHGKITADQIEKAIQPLQDWLPISKLVVLENTCNKGGGSYYTLEDIKPIQALCKERNLILHLDGARLFNALIETGETTQEVGKHFDSISICLSKGLGAPVGSLLIGEEDFIRQARRFRKVMGGGMRQAGYLAAAGLYALQNNIERLKIDNDRAKGLGKVLEECSQVLSVRPVQSNIVIFDLPPHLSAQSVLDLLAEEGILASPFGSHTIRLVTHLDISEEDIKRVQEVLLKTLN